MADLNFLNIDNCDAITLNTPTTDLQIIEYITASVVRDYSDVDKYTVTYSNNCCSPGVTTEIAPRYEFELSESCEFEFVTPGFDAYAIQVDGINGDLVQSITLLNDGVPADGWSWSSVSSVLSINDVQIAGVFSGVVEYVLTITTLSGFVYVIEFIITKSGAECDGVLSGTTITYPDLPSNIVIQSTMLGYQTLDFNELLESDSILPGVYEVIICEVYEDDSSLCVQNHVFIDCGTLKCQVVNKWVQCVDSNIMDFYNGLIWSNDCTDTITYNEVCAIYEILTIILQSDACYGMLDDCNCSDAPTIANKFYPVNYPSQTNSNPCRSC